MDAVTAAFEAVPRTGFLPRAQANRAAYDGPIEIGRGQTNSQPTNRADVLEPALGQRPGRVDQAVALQQPDVDARRKLFALGPRTAAQASRSGSGSSLREAS